MSAWICGIVGLFSGLYAGRFVLDMNVPDILLGLLASNVAGMAALLLTLKGERMPWIRKHVLGRSLRTWPIFLLIYFSVMLLLAPPLRDVHRFEVLFFPLMLSTGFTILVFGPIQDRIVARIQRRARAP